MKIHKSLRLLFVFTALMFLSLSVNAQTVNGKQKLLIIEGHFFNEIPVAKDLISKINIVSTPSGTKAMGLTLSKPLPEEALKYEIPKDKVKDADELLQRLKETKDNSITISINASKTPLLKEGDAFPEFTATDINGKTWTNADVKGKVMVLNLWFTGCAPRRKSQTGTRTAEIQLDSADKRQAVQKIHRHQRLSFDRRGRQERENSQGGIRHISRAARRSEKED